jgi:hypothetical protein
MAHEAEAEAWGDEAEAEAVHFGLEAEARPRGLTSLHYTITVISCNTEIAWALICDSFKAAIFQKREKLSWHALTLDGRIHQPWCHVNETLRIVLLD